MSHVIERKEFIQNKELSEQSSINENNYQVHNILKREEFVDDEELKNKYSDTILPVFEYSHEVKLLGSDEKVLGFEEYVKSKTI